MINFNGKSMPIISPEFMKKFEREGFYDSSRHGGDSKALGDVLLSLPSQVKLKPTEKEIEYFESEKKKLMADAYLIDQKGVKLEAQNKDDQETINFNDDRLYNQVGNVEEAPSHFRTIVTGVLTGCVGVLLSVYTISVSYAAFFSSPLEIINKISSGSMSLQDVAIESVLNKYVIQEAFSNPWLVSLYVLFFGFLFTGAAWLMYHLYKKRSYLDFIMLNLLILFMDFVLGFKISKDLHYVKQRTGQIGEIDFNLSNLIQSESFGLILVSGIATFIIFEKLLWMFLEQLEKHKPQIAIFRENNLLKKQIKSRLKKFRSLEEQKEKINAKILKLSIKIDGSRPSFDALKEILSAYKVGWNRFIIQSDIDVDLRLKRAESVFNHTLRTISKSY